MAPIESSTQTHRDAALHFTVGVGVFTLVSGVGSILGAAIGEVGIVVALLAILAGVYLGGLEVARGIEVVVESAGERR